MTTSVVLNSITTDVSRQGHGVQRAVIAMLQALVPDHEALETGDDSTYNRTLLLSIEEPEIYQHPIRARSFARVLTTLAARADVQVIVATHSPHFVRPEHYPAIRRMSICNGSSTLRRSTYSALAVSTAGRDSYVRQVAEKHLPSSFSEAFCKSVVLLEGQTDHVIFRGPHQALGLPVGSVRHVAYYGRQGEPARAVRNAASPRHTNIRCCRWRWSQRRLQRLGRLSVTGTV